MTKHYENQLQIPENNHDKFEKIKRPNLPVPVDPPPKGANNGGVEQLLKYKFDIVTSVIKGLLIYIPPHLDNKVYQILQMVSDLEERQKLTQRFLKFRQLRTDNIPPLIDLEAEFWREFDGDKIDNCEQLIQQINGGGAPLAHCIIDHYDGTLILSREHSELYCRKILQLWPDLSQEIKRNLSLKILLHQPNSIGPLIILGSCTDVPERLEYFTQARKKFDEQPSRLSHENVIIICLLLNLPDLAYDFFEQHLRINDLEHQATAIFSLMPYMPNEFSDDTLGDFVDINVVGQQIAGLARILSDCVKAIKRSALDELVEAASKLHSEWWIVEALTLTIRRLYKPEEFIAVLHASHRFKNLDLRARIIGRTVFRMADLGHVDLAISNAESIELQAARWRILGELSQRLASDGDLAGAKAAARKISGLEDQSKAYAEVVLELGAQGRKDEAQFIIEHDIVLEKWRLWVKRLVGEMDKPSTVPMKNNLIVERIARRQKIESGVDQFSAIEMNTKAMMLTRWNCIELTQIHDAAVSRDQVALMDMIEHLWNKEDDSGVTFIERITEEQQPKLLEIISCLAPLIAFKGGPSDVLKSFEAVRDICRWWR